MLGISSVEVRLLLYQMKEHWDTGTVHTFIYSDKFIYIFWGIETKKEGHQRVYWDMWSLY
jgi:hypothetical protein